MTSNPQIKSRILRILQLFDRERVWMVEDIAREMSVSVSSAYRDIQELCRAGFLDPVTGAGYVLGPAFIQYDWRIRQSDPLIRVAAPQMRTLLDRTTQRATAVLCRRFRDCVISVHEEAGSAPHVQTTYERGVAMPLFVGASSKVILAHLDDRTLKRTYLNEEEKIRTGTGAGTWKEFRDQLREIRRSGFAMTISEVKAGRAGIAAPISAERQVIAGISLVLGEEEMTAETRRTFPAEVMAAARRISEELGEQEVLAPRG